jgi:SPP1 gp7 family putative phage head morphogenesis protein
MVAEIVGSTGERARAASESHWRSQVSRVAGLDVAMDNGPGRELLQAWIATNTARIQSLRNESLDRIRDDIETALLSQVRPEELAAKWMREGLPTLNGTLRGRATVIARDQIGKLAGQLAEQQQRALGITRYRWDAESGGSRRHRPVHLGRHGAVYEWNHPPPGGHPKHAVGCQCKAVAVVDPAELRRRLR